MKDQKTVINCSSDDRKTIIFYSDGSRDILLAPPRKKNSRTLKRRPSPPLVEKAPEFRSIDYSKSRSGPSKCFNPEVLRSSEIRDLENGSPLSFTEIREMQHSDKGVRRSVLIEAKACIQFSPFKNGESEEALARLNILLEKVQTVKKNSRKHLRQRRRTAA